MAVRGPMCAVGRVITLQTSTVVGDFFLKNYFVSRDCHCQHFHLSPQPTHISQRKRELPQQTGEVIKNESERVLENCDPPSQTAGLRQVAVVAIKSMPQRAQRTLSPGSPKIIVKHKFLHCNS